MNQSENIDQLIAALSKAQGEMKPAVFNKRNPHFKNQYADFTSCMDACRAPLSANGLAITQMPNSNAEGKLVLITMIAHTSGQWIKGEFPLITAKLDSQGIGSAMTYAKRYSLCGMLGIVADEDIDDDDDGEASVGRLNVNVTKPVETGKPSVATISEAEYKEMMAWRYKMTDDYRAKFDTLANAFGKAALITKSFYTAQKALFEEHLRKHAG